MALLLAFAATFLAGLLVPANRLWISGLAVGIVAVIAFVWTLVLGIGAYDQSRRRRTIAVYSVLSFIVGAMGTGCDFIQLLDVGFELPRTLALFFGWLLGAPLGLAFGALLAQVGYRLNRLGREPIPAFAIGTAIAAVLVAWLFAEIRPNGSVATARFASLGPGAALSVAEIRCARGLAPTGQSPPVEALYAAAPAIFSIKLIMYALAMLAGGLILGIGTRVAAEESRR
jgi:hypothetical protein